MAERQELGAYLRCRKVRKIPLKKPSRNVPVRKSGPISLVSLQETLWAPGELGKELRVQVPRKGQAESDRQDVVTPATWGLSTLTGGLTHGRSIYRVLTADRSPVNS